MLFLCTKMYASACVLVAYTETTHDNRKVNADEKTCVYSDLVCVPLIQSFQHSWIVNTPIF